MRIQVKGRSGVTIDDELRSRVDKKLDKVARQVSALAELELELSEERNPAIRESQVAEATLHLKGVTLRARESSTDMGHSINLVAGDLARQVKKHRDKRRGRREAHRAAQERAAFVMRHFHGCSIDEICASLDIAPNAAKHAVFRAVKKMRAALRPLMAERVRVQA